MDSDLQLSIQKTLSYAAFFNFPLTKDQLHFWLISSKRYSYQDVTAVYRRILSSEEKHLLQERLTLTQEKTHLARQVTSLLSHIPSIKLIALTGSLAVSNAKADDDIDLMIVTSSNTLWLTRLIVIPLISLFFKRRHPKSESNRDSICLNLWLDQTALEVPFFKQNLYTAHEVLQIQTLYDPHCYYGHFIYANSWTQKYLANAYSILTTSLSSTMEGERNNLISSIIRLFNSFAYKIQYLYMKPRITRETIGLHSAFFHPRDLSNVLEAHLCS